MRPGQSERLIIVNRDFDNSFQQLQLFSNPGFKDLNIRADDRVGEVPNPQQLNLGFHVDRKLYIVPVIVSYEYNPDYDPHRHQDSAEDCIEFNATEQAIFDSVASAELSNEVDSISISENVESRVTPEISGEYESPQYSRVAVSGLLVGVLLVFIWAVRNDLKS